MREIMCDLGLQSTATRAVTDRKFDVPTLCNTCCPGWHSGGNGFHMTIDVFHFLSCFAVLVTGSSMLFCAKIVQRGFCHVPTNNTQCGVLQSS